VRNNPQAEENIARLLAAWRRAGRPIYHIQHMSTTPGSPLRPELPGNAIKDIVKPEPGEPLLRKTVNSAFIGTDLEERLRKGKQSTVVITGLTTDHCVSTTARMAANLGFKTYVVSDAAATFDRAGYNGKHYSGQEIHDIELSILDREFATVVDTDTLLEALNGTAETARTQS
jgi:nicotinamidase-related amidase